MDDVLPHDASARPRPSRRRARALALSTGLAAVAGTLGAAPATAADSWSVPSSATITISGRGFGHGHGMSQYGAEGAAREGLDHRAILRFYYPGTTLGKVGRADELLTVRLTADVGDDLVVRARPGLVAVDPAARRSRYPLPDEQVEAWRMAPSAGRLVLSYRRPSAERWRWYATLDGRSGPGFGASGRPVDLVTPSGTRAYRGRLQLRPAAAGSTDLVTVNRVSLESYLRGVVPLEIPASWRPAAVRSQAVAARTYALHESRDARGPADLCDTGACQVYGGADAELPASDAAVAATTGQVLLHDGEPAFTQFGSSSGGWTSAGSQPYLRAREDPYDGWSGNPVHSWRSTLTDRDLERAYPTLGSLRSIAVTRRDGNGQWGGRVAAVTLKGSRATVRTSGDELRSRLGLRSTWLTFSVRAR
ncbi:SpoIID/LytB domain-containing protein [Nocardioides sp. TRM66260-LWL]|uniref:SpoIID/LytB domain-containing protein n=1 Tax=Nocardioides sp. TRM66260-LWL TaxID=2874478 RepID=UPI001CC5856D|nr:SpoIID/LytB domain-containing protein [Nocardioides sp. TRM66260-LWL]MBZ5733278.1 SpoIID/LytB domain-containing protein [Nocardioides sp. TRM66260-LWL]